MAKKKFRLSITWKMIIIIFVFGVFLVEIAMLYFTLFSSNTNKRNYKNTATNLAGTIAEVVDVEAVKNVKEKVQLIMDEYESTHGSLPMSDDWGSEAWNEYVTAFKSVYTDKDYLNLLEFLRLIENVNTSEIDCVFLCYIDVERELFVYLVDSSRSFQCPPGCLDPIYDVNREVLTNPTRGFPAYITNTEEYGYLVSAGTPIFDGEEVIGYAFTDISMTEIRAKQANSIIRMFIYLVSTVLVLSGIGIVIIHFSLIRPLKRINEAASSFYRDDSEKSHKAFSKLNIHTHDELQDLAESVIKMEKDVNEKIDELKRINAELVSSQKMAQEMRVLANKDALTGVRNKIAYDTVVEKINRDIQNKTVSPFGIIMIDLNYLKEINDDYGHDSGDNALMKLCNLICATFMHSPVFRIGGDEFIVIIRNTDYDRSEALIKGFNYKIEELQHDKELLAWEKISAALGVARFDASIDTCVDDVFKRADKAMYERKHEMKNKKE